MRISTVGPIPKAGLGKQAPSGGMRSQGQQQAGRESQSAAAGNAAQDQAQLKTLQGMAEHVSENSRQMNELARDIEQIKALLNTILAEIRHTKPVAGPGPGQNAKEMHQQQSRIARNFQR